MEVTTSAEKVKVTITLEDKEAGYLRKILYDRELDGFGYKLLSALMPLNLPEYEKRYPGWKNE